MFETKDFLTKLVTWFTHHIFSIIVKENQTSPGYILQKQVLCVIIRNTHTHTQYELSLFTMHKKIKEEINAFFSSFFFAKYHSVNSTQH